MEQAQRLYEVITETGMPHLEENLRYATRIERMDPSDLATAFWMLRDVSLQDCKLVKLGDGAEECSTSSSATEGMARPGARGGNLVRRRFPARSRCVWAVR
jgi:hypothetical protein